VMSMVGAGLARHPVVDEGIQFLIRSARPDGSWPIDTNLSTWVTTLSVNALAAGGALEEMLGADERRAIRDWLLGQQHRVEHPYTRAAPGGWAWTDLPGGVPDADDTPGALLALYHLNLIDAEVTAAAAAGVRWLLDLQNRDGGMPTFCRGWGALPFDRSGADLTAHVLHACSVWRPRLPPDLAARVQGMTTRALRYLATVQRADGAWTPLWFGNQFAPDDANPTYGTARVLLALADLPEEAAAQLRKGGQGWLLRAQNADGGWGGDQGVASTIEETALAVQALQAVGNCSEATAAIARGAAWLIAGTDCGLRVDASPIGFYFARLWYYEALYPSIFLAGALEQIGAAPHGG